MNAIAPVLRTIFGSLERRLIRFKRDENGLAAVEFAMLLPLMMTLYLGGFEVSQGVGAQRKTTLVSRTVADLVAQAKSVNDADMQNIFNAAIAVAAPYPRTPLKIVVSSVSIDATMRATIAWSSAYNTAGRTVGDVVTVPTGLGAANSTLIWAEVTYGYKPAIGYVVSGTLNLKDQLYMRPRLVSSVARTAT